MNKPTNPIESAKNNATQSIAHSSAMALSDATDNLRNLSSIGTTAIGVALSQFIETGDSKYLDGIDKAGEVVTQAINNFSEIGTKVKENIE
ncbi:hypothetical protein GNP82_16720 [Aliivibrio fischeri]|uniref:hypothetical protein n=1 Tax=Aliivibrio fischeri TaxID=668 RepID=UPI0012D9291D|nr:hypothetical protein [Aliivibrio fischeri]MUK39197.1 hypothetical protein [Aliivibrio fischeri]MUL04103.1 hypothetical protein [Aliivibrio fischeri]MUL06671.1 hypothetical protein [Aliivibrio fischeri]